MKWKYKGNTGLWLSAMTMLLGSAVVIQAAPSSVNGTNQPPRAARLLRDIKTDATQVQSAAVRLDTLTKSSASKWLDYDRQWNEIQPSVDDMKIKLARLETMQATVPPAERKELDQDKQLIGEIQSRANQLRMLLDEPGVQTNDARFKACARSLRSEAGKLDRTAAAS